MSQLRTYLMCRQQLCIAMIIGKPKRPQNPPLTCDKSLPSKHRAMGTQDAYSIVLAPPCLRRRLRCRESAAHDLPQLRCATCAPVIRTCRS